MSKITINVNDEELEVDLETLDKETAEKLGINIRYDDECVASKKNKWKKVKNKIISITPFVVLIAYFLTGFLLKAWKWNWTFFFAIPLISKILNIKFSRPKKALSSILYLLIVGAYFVTGFLFNIWSWNWVLVFLFPIISILFGEQNEE